MAAFKTLDDVDVAGKRVLVRVDLNVPMDGARVTDDTRLRAIEPTLRELAQKGAKTILLAHFGRPKGKPESSMSLAPLVKPLSQALGGVDVKFAPDCIGELAHAEPALLDTLRTWIALQCNTSRTSEVLYTHRNTVIRRLARAEELLPRPLDESLLDVGVALEVLRWRG